MPARDAHHERPDPDAPVGRHQNVPAGRYGPPRGAHRTRWVIGVGVAAALGLAIVVWLGLAAAQQPVRWSNVGYEITSRDATTITFDVIMAPGRSATCTLEALDRSRGQVGVREVDVSASDTRLQRVTQHVATQSQAVTVIVSGCRLAR